jgi:hypothetical protein
MVIEIDTGTYVETDDMSAVTLSPEGRTMVIVDSIPYESTRFSFEMLLSIMRQHEQRGAQEAELAY